MKDQFDNNIKHLSELNEEYQKLQDHMNRLATKIRAEELSNKKAHIEVVKDLKSKLELRRSDGAIITIPNKSNANWERYVDIDGTKYITRMSKTNIVEHVANKKEQKYTDDFRKAPTNS